MFTCILQSFFDPPQPIILYNFILTSVENYLPEELGGDVPFDWLGGLTPVRLHGSEHEHRAEQSRQ